MEFRKLNAVFGKLSGETISFAPGLNIIQAPNESGKSTLAAALRVMLYGLATRERGTAADKNRYMPWSGGAMEGRLDLISDGEAITITRTTARANSPMGQFSAVYTGTNEPVPTLSAADCGEQLLGVPREVFERSAFIRQSGLAIDQDKELERRIAALITTGEEEGVSYSEVNAKLKKLLNARKHNKTGRIPVLETTIAESEAALTREQALRVEWNAAQEELRHLNEQGAHIAAALAQHDLADAQDKLAALMAAEAACRESGQKAVLFAQMLQEEHTPAQEVLLDSRSKLRALYDLEAQREEVSSRRAQAKAALDEHVLRGMPPLPAVYRVTRLLSLVVLVVFSFCALRREPTLTVVSGAVLLALLSLFVFGSIRHGNAYKNKRAALERALADATSALQVLDAAYRSAEEALLEPLGIRDASRAEEFIRTALARYETLKELSRDAAEKKLRYDILREQASELPTNAAPVSRPAQSREALRAMQRDCTQQLQLTQRRIDLTEGQLRAFGERGELEAGLDAQRTELAQLQLEYDALSLALDALEQANTQLQNRFSPELGRRAAALFARLTGGKYDAVLLDRSLGVSAQEQGGVAARDVSALSQGAADQLYLAVRLAICDLVLPQEKRIPLILDDALINFDDERCAAALDLLVELARERQILLLTCHSREAEYLRARGDVQRISLQRA